MDYKGDEVSSVFDDGDLYEPEFTGIPSKEDYVWVTKSGEEIKYYDMTTSHIRNIVNKFSTYDKLLELELYLRERENNKQ